MTRRIALCAGLVVSVFLAGAREAAAQKTPTVLLHGLASNASTWNDTAARLTADFAVEVYRRDTNWRASFEDQASDVNSSFGSLPPSTIAIGHSNGGLVARVWNGSRPLGGVITIGTPNQGAPLLANTYLAGRDAAELVESVADVFTAASSCPGACDWLSIWAALADSSALTASLADYAMSAMLTGIMPIVGGVGVEMLPGSSFLENVNSGAHLAAEQTTPTRVGLVSTAHNWYFGGWMRAVFGQDADWMVTMRDVVAIGLDGLGWSILATAAPGDTYAEDLAWSMMDAAWNLNLMDYRWCRNVSQAWYTSWYGLCEPSDSVVPTWSQYLPGGTAIEIENGPVHIEETSSWNRFGSEVYDGIHQVMESLMNVPPAGTVSDDSGSGGSSAAVGSDGGSGGSNEGGGASGDVGTTSPGAMTPNAAIRGCTNYVEWSPVFQPNASHCLDYCVGNGADACEWNESGSCYVEFGAGCYVQEGFSAWYAAVLSHSGSPEADPAIESATSESDSQPVEAQ